MNFTNESSIKNSLKESIKEADLFQREKIVEMGQESNEGNAEETFLASSSNHIESTTTKSHKSFSETMNHLSDNFETFNTCKDSENLSKDESEPKNVSVNVFVPTMRKIFSPVRRDSKGKTSSVIGYVIKESHQNNDLKESNEKQEKIDKEKSNEIKDSEEDSEKKQIELKHNSVDDDERREEIHFIMPPCWILREKRAQSASPALQRRNYLPTSKKDSQSDKFESSKGNINRYSKVNDVIPNVKSTENSNLYNSVQINKNELKTSSCKTPPFPRKEKSFSRDSSADSSVESSNIYEHKVFSVSSSRKARADAGFPPISPIAGRRENKLSNKEAAPSIRMMIARYNQKVTESQELIASKSPESDSGSPVSWRSPGTKRRVKAQMERYQEEIRKVVQGTTENKSFLSGEVKKSASASVIRSWDKSALQDGFNRRPSDGNSDKIANTHFRGILKSSSAGTIKTSDPVANRTNYTNLVNNKSYSSIGHVESLTVNNENADLQSKNKLALDKKENKTENRFDRDSKSTSSDTKLNKDPIMLKHENTSPTHTDLEISPQSSKLRALKIKKAKEEFLQRGPGGGSWSNDTNKTAVVKNEPVNPTDAIVQWSRNKCRLSQISCESDCSYEGILVSGEEQQCTSDARLLVKSASAGMINVDHATLNNIIPLTPINTNGPSCSSDIGMQNKSNKFGFSNLASRFRKVRMRRHKEKESSTKMETVSALCRQSLLLDLQRDRKHASQSSKSCPSSPVLQKRDSNSSWIMKPHRIFKSK